MRLKKTIKMEVFKTGSTITEFASAIGISRQTISRALNGESVSPGTAKRITEALELSLSQYISRGAKR